MQLLAVIVSFFDLGGKVRKMGVIPGMILISIYNLYRRVTRVGAVSPALFRKLEKKCPHFGKRCLEVSSVGKISRLKCNFQEFPGEKNWMFFCLQGLSFSCCSSVNDYTNFFL